MGTTPSVGGPVVGPLRCVNDDRVPVDRGRRVFVVVDEWSSGPSPFYLQASWCRTTSRCVCVVGTVGLSPVCVLVLTATLLFRVLTVGARWVKYP